MANSINLQWFYLHPPELVWKVLTTPEMIAEWLMENNFKLQVGHKFKLTAKPTPGWSGIVECEILEIEQHKKLSYTWISGPKPGSNKVNTIVTWKLISEKNGTLLVLEHAGFKGFHGWFVSKILGSGWKGDIAKAFANILEKVANDETES